jgi:hypothetical protein
LLELAAAEFERAVGQGRGAREASLPLDPEKCPPICAGGAAENRQRLRAWAETCKIALASGADPTHVRLDNLSFWIDGRRVEVGPAEILGAARLPTLDELEDRLAPRLAETVRSARQLLARQGLEGPDVVLHVGMGSRFPLVGRTLRESFPQSEHVIPPDPKECVVRGACRMMQGAVQARNALVRIRRPRSATATTSRIGLIENDGRARFVEVIGAGERVPEEGLVRTRPIVISGPGAYIHVKENAGMDDRVIIDGVRNPDIEEIVRFRPVVPAETSWEALEQAELDFALADNLDLRIVLRIPGVEPQEVYGQAGRKV